MGKLLINFIKKCGNDLIIKREKGIPDIPKGYEEYVRIYQGVALIVTCGLDGVVGLCSTLHQTRV